MLGRATLVTEGDIFRRDMGVHSRGGVSRVRIAQFADDKIGSWRGRFSRCELNSDVRCQSRPTAGDSELVEDVS